ncbi:MAG: DUF1232 domain-containing protein [Ignavibacteria bacterium]|nr:DUF1232 domain-containing protein [Ignavibacteria bacterium]
MNKSSHLKEDVFEAIQSGSEKIKSDDLNKIVSNEKYINLKSSELDKKKFSRLLNQLKLTLNLIKDFKNKRYTEIPWRSIAMISASVLYFVNPFDIVPDLLPVFGFTDDALLFAAVFKSIQSDLEKYCSWKGLKPESYF